MTYTGFSSNGQLPYGPGAVQAGGYSVTVAGRRYGKGSSREHSPAAEKLAGIRLVIVGDVGALGAQALHPVAPGSESRMLLEPKESTA